MNIGATSAVNLYNYQSTVQSSGQSAAVLQALAQTYSGAAASGEGLFSSTDSLSALAGSSDTLGSLMGGIYSASAANGSTDFSAAGLSTSSIGGLDSSSASSLLNSLGKSSSSSSNPLENLTIADLNPGLASAIAKYQYQQSVGASSANPNAVSQLVQTAQSLQATGTLNLLG